MTRSLIVEGVVQGVGFRPFVWRLATELGLSGRVRNAAGRVEIDATGMGAALALAERRLNGNPARHIPSRALDGDH